MEKAAKYILKGKQAVLDHLTNPTLPSNAKYDIASDWIVELIGEIAVNQYPYNADVKREAEKRLGLPESEYGKEGDALSALVYVSQNHRRYLSDIAKREELGKAGYQPFTDKLLQEAFESGKKIELWCSPSLIVVVNGKPLPDQNTKKLRTKKIGDTIYAMMPRSRSKHLPPRGQMVKLVD
jgi:hypothetical protein